MFAAFGERQAAQGPPQRILDAFHRLCTLVRESGLETTKNFESVVAVAEAGDVDKLIELKSVNKPVKAGKSKAEKEKQKNGTRVLLLSWNDSIPLPLNMQWNRRIAIIFRMSKHTSCSAVRSSR